jgi:hypothetical protein
MIVGNFQHDEGLMRAKVTKEEVVIPKRPLKDVEEVEIKKKDDVIWLFLRPKRTRF